VRGTRTKNKGVKISTNGNKQRERERQRERTKRGGGKCCSPMLLHGKVPLAGKGEQGTIMWTEGMRKNVRKEGDENNEQFSKAEIQRGLGVGGSLSVLNRGKEEQEEKCPSSTGVGREKKTTKMGGKEGK